MNLIACVFTFAYCSMISPVAIQAGYTGAGTITGSATFYFPGPQSDEFYDSFDNVSPDQSASVAGYSNGPFGSGTGAASVSTLTSDNFVQINPSVAIAVESSVAGGLSSVAAGAGGTWTFAPRDPGEYLTSAYNMTVSGYVAPGDTVRVYLQVRGVRISEDLDRYISEPGEFTVQIVGESDMPNYYPYAAGPIYGPITFGVEYGIDISAYMAIQIYTAEGFGNELLRSAQQRTAIYSASGSVSVASVPEPAALIMTGIGVSSCALACRVRGWRRKPSMKDIA